MSGVRVGSRLEQLERVKRQASLEVVVARRREDWRSVPALEQLLERLNEEISNERPTPSPKVERARTGPSRELQLLSDLGVTARDVKFWAVEQGLLPVVARGRVKLGLVEAYAAAHQEAGNG